MLTRRDFTRLALSGVPAAAVLGGGGSLFSAFAQAKPNSLINGVQVGAITYSYRSMPEQTAEAILKYVVDSGISSIELMGGPVETYGGAPSSGRGERGAAGNPPAAAPAVQPASPDQPAPTGSWNGQPCVVSGRGGGGGGGGRGRSNPPTSEQQAAQQEQASKLAAWRTSVSMDTFKKLRQMYNDAGVTIYAWKQLNPNMSDEELEYVFNVAEALGCTHTTLELPTDAAHLKRIGDFAMKKKIYAAYHTHTQGSMTAFDQAFAASKGNMANIDFGHYVAAGNVGGTPARFLEKFHDRISSFHVKDRTTPENCALNLPFGKGETPITQLLQLVKKNKWAIPATVELEYNIPEGSDAVQEVRRCVEYCRAALA